ncbi:hypothetical protein J0S82_003487, partial [Galemys pyrenaicus]
SFVYVRSFRFVRSQLFVGKEKRLVGEPSTLTEKKKEEKLSKADEKISYEAKELEAVISHEKGAHDNWLAAWTDERNFKGKKRLQTDKNELQ